MEKIFYLILACLFAGLLFYIHRLRRQVRRLGKFTQFFYGAASALGMLTVSYEVGRDGGGDARARHPDAGCGGKSAGAGTADRSPSKCRGRVAEAGGLSQCGDGYDSRLRSAA